MTFWEAFFRTLAWRPRQALAGLYWHATKRKVRARNRLRMGAAQAPYAYDYWIQSVEDNATLSERASEIIAGWDRRPRFSILLQSSPEASDSQVKRTIASVTEQFYPDWEMIIASPDGREIGQASLDDARIRHVSLPELGGGMEIEAGVAAANGDFIVPLRAGNLLSASALHRFAEAAQQSSNPTILYGDQDELDGRGRRIRPWFKPDWDPEMFLAQDFVSDACAVHRELLRSVLPVPDTSADASIFAALLAASKVAADGINHVPHIICHVDPQVSRSNRAVRVSAVEHHLRALGASAVAGPFDTVKVEWPLPEELPEVGIIIPTRDKVELLRACVESVVRKTSYPNYSLIIVDNGSTDRKALEYLSRISRQPNIRVISDDRPYNYSAINNFAASQITSPYLCLLNNDTEVIEEDWLTEMMRYAVRPEVGAVGAKLLYDDGTIQHAGVIIGICEAAGHAHRFQRSDQPGYFAQPHLARVVSAVTAACLVVEKHKFEAVGGLDAENLAVAYNDVDLCLKLEAAGWHNVYVPHAVLLHHESKSRGQDSSPKNIDRYMRELAVLQERWGTKTYMDRRHSPNLDRYSETFTLRL